MAVGGVVFPLEGWVLATKAGYPWALFLQGFSTAFVGWIVLVLTGELREWRKPTGSPTITANAIWGRTTLTSALGIGLREFPFRECREIRIVHEGAFTEVTLFRGNKSSGRRGFTFYDPDKKGAAVAGECAKSANLEVRFFGVNPPPQGDGSTPPAPPR